jgi:hypothetical protein
MGAMSFTGKIVIAAVVCAVLIIAGTVGLGAYLWSRHGRGLIENNERQHEQGLAFGRQTDESGCLNEAVARYKRNSGFTGAMPAALFVQACLRSSRPTAGFCDQVPKPFDVLRATPWKLEQSRRVGIDHPYGGQIFVLQQAHCESRVQPPAPSPP